MPSSEKSQVKSCGESECSTGFPITAYRGCADIGLLSITRQGCSSNLAQARAQEKFEQRPVHVFGALLVDKVAAALDRLNPQVSYPKQSRRNQIIVAQRPIVLAPDQERRLVDDRQS